MARDFNGSSGYLTKASPGNLYDCRKSFTAACWINLDTLVGTTWVAAMTKGLTGSGTYQWLLGTSGVSSSTLSCALYNGSSNPEAIDDGGTYSTGTTYHIAMTYDGTTLRFYRGGAQHGTVSTSIDPGANTDEFNIGKRANQSTFFDGRIWEAATWNVPLTAAEIASLAAAYSPRFVRPASLVGYWPIIGRWSPEIEPRGGIDLTLSGTANAYQHGRIIHVRRRSA